MCDPIPAVVAVVVVVIGAELFLPSFVASLVVFRARPLEHETATTASSNTGVRTRPLVMHLLLLDLILVLDIIILGVNSGPR
jgi:hypothetical protein